jgi:23S rRNA (adenine2503-C2)-methyltransferase
MKLSQINARLADLGAKTSHRDRALRAWVQRRSIDTKRQHSVNTIPTRLREGWPALLAELESLVRVSGEFPDTEGASRLLLDLADGQRIESVLLPRDGLCVSTQVGCAVGCRFCMTGQFGLLRQLTSGEIVAQVVHGRARRRVKKVVFMGMGEPAHNLDNVCEAIEFLGSYGAIGHKNLVFSTVGDARVFERLPQLTVKPALALSLHSTDAALRAELLPKAPRLTPEELVAAGEIYARRTGYPIQYQWTLLKGINDTDAEIEGIVRLLHGKFALMNFIPYNSNEGLATTDGTLYTRPSWEHAADLARRLHRRGILTKLRHSAGQDVEGGCGQLRARHDGQAIVVNVVRSLKRGSEAQSQ